MNYYIYKGSRKVDSFYLNSFPFKYVHYLDKKINEKDLEVDDFGFLLRPKFSEMFPIRKNSCIYFQTETEAIEYLNNATESIKTDDRFNNKTKEQLLNYLRTFKVAI